MNYTVIDSKYIRDVKCDVTLYEHNKTGARVVVIPTDDTNRAIAIAFSTPSENSKGIAHIIEHSVLCGSDKYPLKDPFVQLMKGSMYSFLNAMTFSDFTMYPVASTNEKDFKNLAGVYLDAAFAPLLPHKKEVFLQEGHHFELDENGNVKGFNGVVFNEMKGAEGSVDMHIENAVNAALFPGTPYAFESGGLPLDIADLTYDELCDFYRRHYTASNAVIFLYGKLDTEAMLNYIDSEYLSRYERTKRYVIPPIAKLTAPTEVTAPYPADTSDINKGHYFSYNFALPLQHTPLNYFTLRVLERILCSSPGAILKNAMQQAGIGEDFYANVDEIIRCPQMGFVAAKCRENEKEQFQKIIDTELKKLVDNGIGSERLLSAIRMLEFQEKEINDDWAPRGVTLAIEAMAPLLYEEEHPLDMLAFFDAIDALKQLAETDYFERFIADNFLHNTHKTLAVIYPDTNFSACEDKALQAKLAAQLQEADMAEITADYALLNAYRNSEDSEEDAAKIPLLSRGDLAAEPENTPAEIIDNNGASFLFDPQNTNDIAYFDGLFDLRCLPTELLPYVRIYTELVGAMDTARYSYTELSDKIDSYTGGITHGLVTLNGSDFGKPLTPYLDWHCRFLYENADTAAALNQEILTATDFSDTSRIRDLLMQLKSTLTRRNVEASHLTVRSIGLAAYSEKYATDDSLKGYSFYRFLCALLDDFDNRKGEIVSALQTIQNALLSRTSWQLMMVCERSFLENAKTYISGFAALLNGETAAPCAVLPSLTEKCTAAYSAPSQVQYDALCGLLPAAAKKQRGIINVAAHLLSTAYLWQNVRVLGGAYGCFATFERTGEASMISYRDPHLDNTLNVFRSAADYLKALDLSERTLTQYIIGAMNKLDKPKTPYEKGLSALFAHMTGRSVEYDTAVRAQMIHATLDELHDFADLLQQWIDTATVTVIGNEEKIKKAETSFDVIKTLL